MTPGDDRATSGVGGAAAGATAGGAAAGCRAAAGATRGGAATGGRAAAGATPGGGGLHPRLRTTPAQRQRLARVAGGDEPADLELDGGRVLNVFSGTVQAATVAIAEGRVARVGAPGDAAAREDLGDAYVLPGLVDAHTHCDMLYVPDTFLHDLVRHGVTAATVDLAPLTAQLEPAAVEATLDALAGTRAKALWAVRSSGDEGDVERDAQRLGVPWLRRLLERDDVVAGAELVGWRLALAGDERLGAFVAAATDGRRRVDGHAPGASARSLAMLAALGVTSDHEAIDGDEVQRRVEVGLWTMLRHSSLRPDARALAREVVRRGLDTRRMLVTADGVLPLELQRAGHADEALREVIAGGIDPVEAIRMATLHPATYLGLDAHLGSVAPGRCADLVLVDDLAEPRPARVMADGRWTGDDDAAVRLDWSGHERPLAPPAYTAADLAEHCAAGPPLRQHGAFARLEPEGARGPALIALAARDGTWLTATTIHGFDVAGVACTFTGTGDVLLVGHDPDAIVAAHAAVAEAGGGMAGGGVTVPMPVFGMLSDAPLPRLAEQLAALERATGLPSHPPFGYQATFLTLPALPAICLTREGLLDVRAGTLVAPATPT